MIEDWKVDEKVKLHIMLKNQRLMRLVVKFSIPACIVSCLIFVYFRSLSLYNFKSVDESDVLISRPLFYKANFFFDVEKSPIYEIIYFNQTSHAFTVGLSFICYNSLIIISILHLCDQLRILKLDIENLTTQSKNKSYQIKIKEIVQRHFQLKK